MREKRTSSKALARTWPYVRRVQFQQEMRQIAARYFAGKDLVVDKKYPFILARWEDWPHNIILPEVVDYILSVRRERVAAGQGFALHKYIHHGLSSQAMLFNLIGPLIVHHDLPLLNSLFDSGGLTWPPGRINAILEYEDRSIFNEDSGQPTSIDLVLTDQQKQPFVFIEFKFTEDGFGGCSLFAGGDCDGRNPAGDLNLCYLHHIGRKYWTLLEKHHFLDVPMQGEMLCPLALHYQFFRIVLFALEHERPCIFICDERNPTFYSTGRYHNQPPRGLLPLLMEFVPAGLRDHVVTITVQEMVRAIEASGRHPWINEFKRKYGLVP